MPNDRGAKKRNTLKPVQASARANFKIRSKTVKNNRKILPVSSIGILPDAGAGAKAPPPHLVPAHITASITTGNISESLHGIPALRTTATSSGAIEFDRRNSSRKKGIIGANGPTKETRIRTEGSKARSNRSRRNSGTRSPAIAE